MTEQTLHRYAWSLSNAVSLILLILLIFILHKAYQHENRTYDIPLRTHADVMHHLDQIWLKRYSLKPPIFVPTGIYINDISFKSANDLSVVLYVWQRYPLTAPANIDPIFYIMEQIEFTNQLVLYDKTYQNEKIKSVYVETKVRQQFDYHKYPFDNKVIYVSVWPKDYTENVILIPDFSAYTHQADELIGIYPNIRLRGFFITDSYFGYKASDYNVNFGHHESLDILGYPYLYFAIVLKRALFSAFVFHILPLLIAYIILFSILMMNTERKYKLTRFRFTGTMTITNCSTLFFVLVVIHIGLRAKLYSNQIIYLEYFYLLIYILLALVILNNYILLSDGKKKFKLLHYGDNLIPKILFWPAVLIFSLIISVKVLF